MALKVSRRDVLTKAVAVSALAPAFGLFGKNSSANGLTPLDPEDSSAKALGFVTDAVKVDSGAHPTFRVGQICANCSLYQGAASVPTAGCSIFPGRSVPGAGWCKVWSRRSS